MLDPKLVRDHFNDVKAALEKRQMDTSILNSFKQADDQWREHLQACDELKNKRNALTPKGKPTPEQLEELKALSETIKEKQAELLPLEAAVKDIAYYIPNLPDSSTPVGQSEDDNVEIYKKGDVPQFKFDPKSHDDIGLKCGILDFEAGTKIAGSRFVVLKGWGSRLERSIINLMLDTHTKAGYTEYFPPVIVNSASLKGTGQLPKFKDDSFAISDTDYWLSPTAEVQLTNLYADSIVAQSDLPVKMTAFTPCFRKEAGSYGKDIKGIIRLHQFQKVELVHLVAPENSEAELERLRAAAEHILQLLKLPYRVVELCTADLGFSAKKTYDLEVWLPSQNTYREISSCSNFGDFQSRRAMIRYKQDDGGKVTYLHTLNGSGLAVGRTMAAILENYQNEDGSVTVPDVLQPYMGITKIPAE